MSSINAALTPECQKIWAQRQGSMEMVSKGAKGTPLFPGLKFMVDGMEEKSNYSISLTLERLDSTRLTFKNGVWARSEVRNSKDTHPYKSINHPDGIQTGEYWRSHPIEFDHLRITSKVDLEKKDENVLFVRTMYRYVAVLTVNDLNSGPIRTMIHTAQFIPVSVYQDSTIGRWKSQYNKYATVGNGGLGVPGKMKKSGSPLTSSSPITPVTAPMTANGTQYSEYNTGFYPMSTGYTYQEYDYAQTNYSYPPMAPQLQHLMLQTPQIPNSQYGGPLPNHWTPSSHWPIFPPTASMPTHDITAAHWPHGSSMASSMTAESTFNPSSGCPSGSSSPGTSMGYDFNGFICSTPSGSSSGLSLGYSTTSSVAGSISSPNSTSGSSGFSSPATSLHNSFDESSTTTPNQSLSGSSLGSTTPNNSSDDSDLSTCSLLDVNEDYSIAFKPYEFLNDEDIQLPY